MSCCNWWRGLSIDGLALLGREFEIAAAGRRLGERANIVFGGLDSRPGIATITMGGIKYAYEGDVIDLMGLNETRMAHNDEDRIGFSSHAAFEVQTFFELNPTLGCSAHSRMGRASRPAVAENVFADNVLKGAPRRDTIPPALPAGRGSESQRWRCRDAGRLYAPHVPMRASETKAIFSTRGRSRLPIA